MLEYGWYPLLLFIATPWFLHQLGTEQYGHWMLLTATAGFGGILNTGTGAATIKAVSSGIGRTSSGDIERAIRISLALAMLGGSALALFVFVVFCLAGGTLLARMGDPALIQLTGLAAALLIMVEQLDNVFSSALKGAEQFGQAARIEIASKTAQIFTAALVVLPWPRLWALYTALLLISVLRLLAKTMVARRLFELSNLRPTLNGSKEILHFAKWGWLQGVGGVLFGVADRMLVGSLLGASSLTYYSIASQLAMQVHAVTAAGLSVIFPKISRKIGNADHFSLWRVTKITMAGNLVLSSLLALILILFGPMLLRIWIGADSATKITQILPWLALAYWVLALNVVPYYTLLGMGRIRFVGLTVLTAGAAAAVAMFIAISRFGLIGAPAGRGIYAIFSLALIFPLARHFMNERNVKLMGRRISAAPDNEILP